MSTHAVRTRPALLRAGIARPARRRPAPRRTAPDRPASPTLPRLWLASAACEAAVALGAAGAFFFTHSSYFR